ncbi:hypothetical protein K9L67_03700 [Candidatus Woesearchaeota archaeon]|nr:hypothetical protein [Candidatus Woesearchaeota archaeon]MCF7901306.1 hypothetical protein [Candidatus Woesearchaeota archaeon]MCF8013788.1 hypothetical protein [Candidatus Woesearchaeota archaeon]
MNISISDKMLYWLLIFLPLLSLVFGLILALILSSGDATKGVYEGVQQKLIESRMMYSPNCLAYYDEANGRTYSGTIDLKKMSEKNIRTCIDLKSNSEIAYSVEIEYETKEKRIQEYKSSNFATKPRKKSETNTYPVQIYGYGPGKITFTYIY